MAKSDPDFSQVEKRIKELDARIKALGGEGFPNIDKALKAMNGDIDQAKYTMKLLSSEAADLENVFENISETLKNVVLDLNGGTKAATLMNRSFNKLERVADKLVEHRKDENILTIRQLKELEKQSKLEVEKLKFARDRALAENVFLEKKEKLTKAEQNQLEKNINYIKETNEALSDKESYLKKITRYSELEVKREKEIQKTLGLTGQAFKGIASTLEKIGVESEAIEDINLAMRRAAKTGDGLKVIFEAIKGSALAAFDTLTTDPAAQLAFLTKTFQTLYNIGAEFSKNTATLARDLGMSSKEAAALNKEFYNLQLSSNDAFGNQKNFLQSTLELNEALGTSATFSADVLATQARIAQVTGLTGEESAEIYKFSLLTGKTQEEIYDSVGAIRKGNLNNKKVLQEVLKTSGQLGAQYKNDPKEIGKAVVQAQKLGLTLKQTQEISKNLLNFEDSISAELEAELLTGQDLNLERARYLALMGDSAGAAEELMKNLGPNGLAKFQNMNVIQQEAYARALGMSVDELADSLVKQKQLDSLGKQQSSALKKRIQELKEAGEVEKAAELEKQVLAGKNVELAEQQLDAQARIAQATETFKSSLQAVIAGPLGYLADKVAIIMETINKSPFAKTVLGGIGAIGAIAAAATSVYLVGKTLITSLTNAYKGKPSGRDDDPIYTKPIGGGGNGQGGDGEEGGSLTDILSERGTKTGGVLKKLSNLAGGKKTMLGRGLRNIAASAMKRGGLGRLLPKGLQIGSSLMGGLGSAGSGLSKIAGGASKLGGKLLAPATSVAMTGKGLYDFFGDEKNRATGVGGFLENLGGTGMHILDNLTFGATKFIGNKTGISIPGMDTDDVASARAIFHASGRDPDGSRTPISMDNKQLINDILNNPSAYPEGIVSQAKEVDIKELAVGGIVTKPTNALVGEAGAEAVIPLDRLMAEFKEMRAILTQIANREGTVYLDGNKIGTAMAMGTYKTQ